MQIPAAKIVIPEEDQKKILEDILVILKSGNLTLGKNGEEFERLFRKQIGIKHSIAVNSGTSALEIVLRSLNIEDKRVIVPTNTFFATPASVLHAGGQVKFIDIEENFLSIDPDTLNENITKDVCGVIMVHIGGVVSPAVNEVRRICDENGIFLLEDAAHAHGSMYDNRYAGTFGDAATFSFYPTKIITTGEGGMITTNHEKIFEDARIYRDQGKSGFHANVHVLLGYNWRLNELNAILGIYQLKRLPEFIESRRKTAAFYDRELKNVKGIRIQKLPNKVFSNYYKYIVFLSEKIDRSELKAKMRHEKNVSLSGEVYELPCHLQPVFKETRYKQGDFPSAEKLCNQHICLPIYSGMTEEEASYVVQSLKEILN